MMDSLELEGPGAAAQGKPMARPPRIWGFWGTALWGLFIFAALFAGQIAVLAVLVLQREGAIDVAAVIHVAGGGLAISLSVIMGLPAVLAALWIAIRISRAPFADYLALRGTAWKNFVIGAVGLGVVVMGWDLLSRAMGREISPGFMVDVLKLARGEGVLWLLVIAFTVAAPVSEELLARGFLYRGWSESAVGPFGAIVLSSVVWTSVHLQYDWSFLGEVFSIGILLGYLRYRYNSTWLTIFVHGLNNLGAVMQTLWLAGPS